jgi:hypothetical protein
MRFDLNYMSAAMAHLMSVSKKHCLVLNKYNSFQMKDNEIVRYMYFCLILIVNELNFIGTNKIGDTYIVKKIISLLPQQKWEHYHHPSELGGLESNDIGTRDRKDCGI